MPHPDHSIAPRGVCGLGPHGLATSTGKLLATLSGAQQAVTRACISPAGDNILAVSTDKAVRVWNVDSGRLRHTFITHTNKVYGAAFYPSGDRALSGSHDRTIKIWDLGRGNCLKSISCFSYCNDLCLSPNGAVIYSAHYDSQLRIWDASTGDLLKEVEGLHTQLINSVCVGSDGVSLLTTSRDNTLKLVDARTHTAVQTYKHDAFRTGQNYTHSCFSPDRSLVCSGAANGTLFVWETESGKVRDIIAAGHTGGINAVSWHGKRRVTAGADASVVLWEEQ